MSLLPAVDDLSTWRLWHIVMFSGVIVGGMELLNVVIPFLFHNSGRIVEKSKPLEKLEFVVSICFLVHGCILWYLAESMQVIEHAAEVFQCFPLLRIPNGIYKNNSDLQSAGCRHKLGRTVVPRCSSQDKLCITSSRLFTIPFIYCFLRFAWVSSSVDWTLDKLSFWNTVGLLSLT